MNKQGSIRWVAPALGALLVLPAVLLLPAAARADGTVELAEGQLSLPVPDGWARKQPRVNIIDAEFEIPAAEGDEKPGRATIMGAGGSIEDNINRWAGQFTQPDGSNTADKVKTRKLEAAGQPITLVDITGTYEDKAGPFVPGPGVQRPNYRMLAAVIETKKAGNYFIKFYGPQKTISGQEAAFTKMLEGLKTK